MNRSDSRRAPSSAAGSRGDDEKAEAEIRGDTVLPSSRCRLRYSCAASVQTARKRDHLKNAHWPTRCALTFSLLIDAWTWIKNNKQQRVLTERPRHDPRCRARMTTHKSTSKTISKPNLSSGRAFQVAVISNADACHWTDTTDHIRAMSGSKRSPSVAVSNGPSYSTFILLWKNGRSTAAAVATNRRRPSRPPVSWPPTFIVSGTAFVTVSVRHH